MNENSKEEKIYVKQTLKSVFILNNEWKFRRLHKEDTLEYVISLLQDRAIDGQFHFMDNWFSISR